MCLTTAIDGSAQGIALRPVSISIRTNQNTKSSSQIYQSPFMRYEATTMYNSCTPMVVLGYKRTVSIAMPQTAKNSIAKTIRCSFQTAAGRLLISLGNPISLYFYKQKRYHSAHTLLLPPSCQVSINTENSPIVSCHLDALGEDYWLLSASMQHHGAGIYSNHAEQAQLINLFSRFSTTHSDLSCVLPGFNRFLELEKIRLGQEHFADARVAEIITSIRATSTDNPPNEYFSDQVHLSRNALERLFRKQIGVSIRKYRLWNRQYEAAKQRAEGISLTNAAINAGFSDAAHYSKNYRRVIGYSPSYLIGNPKTHFFVEDS